MEFFIQFKNDSGVLVGCLDVDNENEIPMISLGDASSPTDIGEYLQIIDADKEISIFPAGYDNIQKTLSLDSSDQLLIVPRPKMTDHFQEMLRRLHRVLGDTGNLTYLVTYMCIRKFLCGLSRALVSKEDLSRLTQGSENITVKSNLKSLLPQDDEFCSKIRYSMSSTATGRLVVKNGPKILTAPSASRSCLKSRFDNGKILQIDMISAEPKFALHEAAAEIPHDVYDHIAQHILQGLVTRKDAKLITLCALYGQSLKKLSKQLPPDISARSVVRKTKEFFCYDRLVSKLKNDYRDGNFRNAVGRPLTVDNESSHLLVSHYLQGSVAEGAILMFSNFINEIGSGCIPLFVIHDALIVDVEAQVAQKLLSEGTVPLYLGSWRFDASVTKVGE